MNEFNRFDICEAYYLYAYHYHQGQGSKAYAIFGRLSALLFTPSPLLSVRSLTGNAHRVYHELIERDY